MTTSMIFSATDPNDGYQPSTSIRVDEDGDVWIKFMEHEPWKTEMSVCMNREQFAEFADKMADTLRKYDRLAEMAKTEVSA